MSIKGFFKDLFRPSHDPSDLETKMSIKDALEDPNTFDFNEDYYRQIEFLPKENLDNVSKTANEITEFSETNFAVYGWWGSYVRSEFGFPTLNRNIPIIEIERLFLERKYFQFKRVTKSQSITTTVQRNTKAFKHGSIAICFNYKDDKVENLWLNLPPDLKDYVEYKEILTLLGNKYSFLLADWWKSVIIDISKENQIEAYLNAE